MNGLAARSPDIVKILLFVGIAYTLITTVWHFVSGPDRGEQQQPIAGVDRTNANSPGVDVQSIIGANIFGDISAAPIVEKDPEPSNEPAKETRLPLTLLGVFRPKTLRNLLLSSPKKAKQDCAMAWARRCQATQSSLRFTPITSSCAGLELEKLCAFQRATTCSVRWMSRSQINPIRLDRAPRGRPRSRHPFAAWVIKAQPVAEKSRLEAHLRALPQLRHERLWLSIATSLQQTRKAR